MSAKGIAYLLLDVGGEVFGLDLELVEAVIPYARPDAVPFQRRDTVEALLYRGKFMGVADLGRLLGLKQTPEEGRAVIAVVETGGAHVGLIASASLGLLRAVDLGDEARVMGKWEGPFLGHSVKYGERVAHIVDFDALIGDFAGRLERSA